jgi:hypothetical protein
MFSGSKTLRTVMRSTVRETNPITTTNISASQTPLVARHYDPSSNAIALLRNLPKHSRYTTAYRRLDYFWGLGIEHETYIATSQTRTVRAFDATALKPERYSVSYYKAYQPAALQTALTETLADASGGLVVPVLMNNHSFTNADVFGEHRTTYEREPKPNPRFEGKTLYEWICEYSAWLRDERDRVFMWDGDTVEFMTQRFYNARVDDVLAELAAGEDRFVAELATLPKRGLLCAYTPLRLAAPRNEPFATYLTHPRGVAMFNNGTIHVNVTLPTRLGWNRQPLWWDDFVDKHRRLARLVQWLEPLWIACYGSGDPFASLPTCGHQFAAGSQRLAVSRYIGVGTYNTDTMPRGKILQIPRPGAGELPWYDWLYQRTAYAPLTVIGLDINFNKHGAHGLELRFFDQMSRADLREVLTQLVVLMDVALARREVPDPRRHPEWQSAAGEALYYGPAWRVSPEQTGALTGALGVDIAGAKEPMIPRAVLTALMEALRPQRGWCWRRMVETGQQEQAQGCGWKCRP